MISRAQRRQTRTEALRRRNEQTKRKRWSFLLTFLLAAVLCASAALAAPEIEDSPTAEQLAALKTTNGSFAYAYDQHEAFVGDQKTGVGLCSFADKARMEGWNYVYGGKGQRMTPGLLSGIITSNLNDARSPYLRDGYIASTLQQVGNRATDCSGLVMNYMWWAGDASDPIHALCPSIGNYNANAMLEAATEKGPVASIPEIPGLLVHSNGHVGIYIGGGEVIEARGVRYGVTKTALSDRSFKYWSKSPWIDYALTGIYDMCGRFVFLDNGEDIGQERWVSKFVYGDAAAGSTYVPVCDPSATFGGSLPAVYDADPTQDGAELLLVDRILAVIDSIPYDPMHGYLYDGHWYVILVDEQGMPEAVLNDPDTSGQPAEESSSVQESSAEPFDTWYSEELDSDDLRQNGDEPADVYIAPNPVPIEPDPEQATPSDQEPDSEVYEASVEDDIVMIEESTNAA